MDLTISIVNINLKDMLRDCLKSIYENTREVDFEVYVVDNASTDDSVEMVRSEFPGVKLILVDTVQGFAANHNQVLRVGLGRYLLILNNDTVVMPGAFDCIVEFMDEHPEAGAVGGKLLNADGSIQSSCWRGFPSISAAFIDAFYLGKLMPSNKFVQRFEIPLFELNKVLEVDHLSGACLAVRREVLDQVGLLDESYFIFLEETDWCYRIRKAGWKISWIPDAQVVHYGGQTVWRAPEKLIPLGFKNYYKFYHKYYGDSWRTIILICILAAKALLRMGLWTVRVLLGKDGGHGKGMIKGFWQVIRQVPNLVES